MSNLLESKVVRTLLWALGGLIIVFTAFGLGIAVGASRAGFAAGFDQNYYHNFYGSGGGMMATGPGPVVAGMMPMPAVIHGIAGTVIDVAGPVVSVQDDDHNEQSVRVSSDTVLREDDEDIGVADIDVGDRIAAIGAPDAQGQVIARFIRVFPGPSSTSVQ